ncbi:TetR/AcrR family transcriptional regulator [Aeromicrobium ginsengisoli]|uniref:TetR family transcriptional regulator n=1 Tax=Aeromicrobium ginsengisoli TaxID=363867 RepID=A0A5M4FE17_9ACTN|nr:TetR family transcriptional regulator [Aeromicrobium ginsengisoli]KAA1397450.1 TetR family transcriptional regulator [Aeromicrobium ginsengisoli]
MTSRAQLSQERSRLRRDELLAAAIELFAEGGSRAITHRAVAARAGLPSATTTYYFESIGDLIREALGAHIDQWSRDLEALAAVDVGADVSIDDASHLISRVFAVRGPEVAALELAIFLAAARVPELRDNAARSMRAFEDLATSLLARVGIHEPGALSASIVTLITGTAVRRQSGLYTEDDEARLLVSGIRGLVAAHAIGPEGVDRTLADLRKAQQ